MSDPTKQFKYQVSGTTYDLSKNLLPLAFGFANNTISNFIFGNNPATDLNVYFARKSNTIASDFITNFMYIDEVTQQKYDLSNLFERMPPCVISVITGEKPIITTLGTDYTFITFTGTGINTSVKFNNNITIYYLIVGKGGNGSVNPQTTTKNGADGGNGGDIAYGSFVCLTSINYNININYNSNTFSTLFTDQNNYISCYNGNSGSTSDYAGSIGYNNSYNIFSGGLGGKGGSGGTNPTSGKTGSVCSGTTNGIYTFTYSNPTIKYSIGNGGGGSGGSDASFGAGAPGGNGGGSGGIGGASGGFGNPRGASGGGGGYNGKPASTSNNGGNGGFSKITSDTVSSSIQSYGNGGGGRTYNSGAGVGSSGVVVLAFLSKDNKYNK